MVSYLPLSHIAAQIYDLWTGIQWGAQVCFAEPDALKVSLPRPEQGSVDMRTRVCTRGRGSEWASRTFVAGTLSVAASTAHVTQQGLAPVRGGKGPPAPSRTGRTQRKAVGAQPPCFLGSSATPFFGNRF